MTVVNPAVASKHNWQWLDAAALLLMAVPFVLYSWTVWQYSVNVPNWDDFSVILKPVTAAFTADTLRDQVSILSVPSNGHLPLLTRLVAMGQVVFFGAINFRHSIFAANAGWLLTVLLLLWYCRRQWQLAWPSLLPVPFVLLSVTHWEAMDFATPAWQMYWGSVLLPLVCLCAAVRKRWLLAVICSGVALFFSSGSLALFPLVAGYLLYRRFWREAVCFGLAGGSIVVFFLYLNPPEMQLVTVPSFGVVLEFIPAFMGNIVSPGSWNLEQFIWLHWSAGVCVMLAGTYIVFQLRDVDLSKLVFLYILLLACMAVYLRGGSNPDVAPRYSLFALLAVAYLYCAVARGWQFSNKKCIAACTVVAAGLWGHSYYSCLKLLSYDHNVRLHFMQQYLLGGDLDKLLWSEEYGREALEESTAVGTYDPDVVNTLHLSLRPKKSRHSSSNDNPR
jgi:hypothetical protein